MAPNGVRGYVHERDPSGEHISSPVTQSELGAHQEEIENVEPEQAEMGPQLQAMTSHLHQVPNHSRPSPNFPPTHGGKAQHPFSRPDGNPGYKRTSTLGSYKSLSTMGNYQKGGIEELQKLHPQLLPNLSRPRTQDPGALTPQQAAKMQRMEALRNQNPGKPVYILLDHMSYPSTTSGRPSEADGEEVSEQAADLMEQHEGFSAENAFRQKANQPIAKAPHHDDLQKLDQREWRESSDGLLNRNPAKDGGPSQFTFTPHLRDSHTKSSTQKRSTRLHDQTDAVLTVAAGQKRKVTVSSQPSKNSRQMSAPSEQTTKVTGPRVTSNVVKTTRHAPAVEHPNDDVDDRPQTPAANDILQGRPGLHRHQSEESDEPIQLDCEPPALFNMDYHKLKNEPFDQDPNAETHHLPIDRQTDSLDRQLRSVYSLTASDQEHYFASLSIDEWEDAGEWFVQRFGDILGKLKDVRRDRRQAALQFETEIKQRHLAVGHKRKQVEDALDEMKASGRKVLQTTPQKVRTGA